MPPRRKYTPSKKTSVTNKRIAAVAKRAIMKQAETKKHQVELIEQSLTTKASLVNTSLNSISQGTAYAQRVGHSVSCSGFAIQGQAFNNNYAAGQQQIVRMMVLRFKNNQADPNQDLLENDANNQPVSPDDLRSLYRRINMDSYEVLASKFINLGGGAGNVSATKVFKMWIPFKRTCRYDATGTVEPNFNRVRLVAFARDVGNDNINPNVEFSFCSTMYYKDL